MPRRKDDPPDLVTLKVRITAELKEQCNIARVSGLHKNDAETSFIRYLLDLGLNKYRKVILPAELSDDETPAKKFSPARIKNKSGEVINISNNGKMGNVSAKTGETE